MSEMLEAAVVALCGPSGVGKGVTKRLILDALGAHGISPVEPVVVTTRLARADDDPSRRACLSEEEFDALVASGEIMLPHRPFRTPGSPLYGFDAKSISGGPLITEVHSSILPEFRSHFRGRPTLVVGLLATGDTLRNNIQARQGDFSDGSDCALRVAAGLIEEQEIRTAKANGAVDHIFICETAARDEAQREVVGIVMACLGVE